jgi:uncharacterized phage-associated protein
MKTPTARKMNDRKMQQAILFFVERINNIHLGRTKLMKLVYYVDFDHFEKYGRSITNARYRKLPHGPVPDKVDKVIASMQEQGLVDAIEVPGSQYAKHRLIPLNGKFDASIFTGDELAILEAVACRWGDSTAAEIEAATHAEAPWASTEDAKAIDYELALSRSPLPVEDADECLAASSPFLDYVTSLA